MCQKFPFTICSQFLFPDAWLFLTPTAYSNDTGLVNSLQIAKRFQILQLRSVPFSWNVFHQFLQLEKNSFRQFLMCLVYMWNCKFLSDLENINTWKISPKFDIWNCLKNIYTLEDPKNCSFIWAFKILKGYYLLKVIF